MTPHLLSLKIAEDHPAFAGHFPGHAIVPGVVLLDEAMQAIGRAQRIELHSRPLSSVKFLSPVTPGEVLSVEYLVRDSGAIQFTIVCGERQIAAGSFGAAA